MGKKRPNFIIFITDDQGYGDLSCMGSNDIRTPHIDRLANTGARFTDWYAASPVCSPSRAALLTGRYPGNAGVRSILGGKRKTSGLLPEVPTISSELKALGYRTGLYGKWHLGLREDCRPDSQGFDEWMGFMAGCIDYYSHIYYWGQPDNPIHDLWENGKEIHKDGHYFTNLVTDHAVDFIRRNAGEEEPFFLYVAYNAPHYPMHAPEKYTERFAHLPWDRRMMAAMLSAVDDGVGDIVAEIERKDILDNTCIFFQSDNGPSRESRNWLDGTEDLYYGGSAGKLKGHKFSLYDGGIRVPGIWNWPAKIPRGQVISEPCCAIDVFPTMIKAAGGSLEDLEIDGDDIMPVLTERATPERNIYWEMGAQTAVRSGKWKLVLNGQLEEFEPPTTDNVHLSDLEKDIGEKTNLQAEYPDVTMKLMHDAEQWRKQIEMRWEQEWKLKS
ncbi:sulfatase-like hydrolase/transferase [Bacillus sp. SD088]|uniref:sulfatase-like hydrolase/transferase n=1 Tax=Bacillus sp. SD088 TaxID=2782012 RepID=UPI001A95656B|nr:sulfatase-like hydrolase/transferase [Bacillus sp. SD088]MBO0995078.1 sulfatase-like hydrolase/transferase [Bacillus sp. SD088]